MLPIIKTLSGYKSVSLIRKYCLAAIPICLGIFIYWQVIGFSALNPQNIEWLLTGDPLQHYIGWEFYRQSSWSLPIGLNPLYGLELSSSIVYSDSIPLFAVIFKLLLSNYSQPFQYFGIWLLVCFVLQAIAAWTLLGLATNNLILRFLCTIPFVLSSPMLGRLSGTTIHYALAAHFLILFSLYLCIANKNKFSYGLWLILLGISISTHFYIFVMVGVMWLASSLDYLRSGKIVLTAWTRTIFIGLLVVLFISWQLGYFVISPQQNSLEGYGWHSLNLISPFNPKEWSAIIKPFRLSHETNEDANYLGLVAICLLPLAVIGAIQNIFYKSKFRFEHHYLVLALVGLTIFSISNNISIGSVEFKFLLPDYLQGAVSLLRSSARMFWPVYYSLLFIIFYYALKTLRARLFIPIFAAFVIVQVADSYLGWGKVKGYIYSLKVNAIPSPLISPFWKIAGKEYKKLKSFPLVHSQMQPDWGVYSKYSSDFGLGTDIVYLARVDEKKIDLANNLFSRNLVHNKINMDEFYIIQDSYVARFIDIAGSSQLRKIDGAYVYSPKGFFNTDLKPLVVDELFPKFSFGKPISFSSMQNENVKFLGSGWSAPEDWGTWSNGKDAEIILPSLVYVAQKIYLTINIYNPNNEKKIFYVTLDKEKPLEFYLSDNLPQTIVLTIPERKSDSENQFLKIYLHAPEAISPASIGKGLDQRNLGIGIISATIK
jgi:hypothetical protein